MAKALALKMIDPRVKSNTTFRDDVLEEAAKCVPSNWCDALLTGPDAPKGPLGNRAVERLLRGIQDRIRALKSHQ